MAKNESFAFETTLSTKTYKEKIEYAKQKGYTVTLIYFWLQNIELAKERVKIRVFEGGHNIQPEIIERIYIKGIKNLFDLYLPVVHGALLFDNSFGKPLLIAQKTIEGGLIIYEENKFNEIKKYYDHSKRTK